MFNSRFGILIGLTLAAALGFTLPGMATQVTLTVQGSAGSATAGTGTVTDTVPGGTINCSINGSSTSGTCQASYASGTSVTLTATANSSSAFAGWSGGSCSGTGTCTITLNSDTIVTATIVHTTTLVATKTAQGTWTRTTQWTISKSANPTTLSSSGTVTYTITVTQNGTTDGATVDGEICVNNDGVGATVNLQISDQVFTTGHSPVLVATVTGIEAQHPILQPGETYCYQYSASIPSSFIAANANFKDTAHIRISNHAGNVCNPFYPPCYGPDPSATTSLPASPTTANTTIHVTDTNGQSFTFSASGSQMYNQSFTCPGDSGTHNNTATIQETGQSSSAAVTVNCQTGQATPSITTTPNPSSGTVGVTLNDSAVLSGGFSPTGSITFKLFSPSDPTCSATPVFTNTVPVNGNGTYSTSSGFTANVAGIWHWQASYSGDANNAPVSDDCAAEPVTVSDLVIKVKIKDEKIPAVGQDITVDLLFGSLPAGLRSYDMVSKVGDGSDAGKIARIEKIESKTIDPRFFEVVNQQDFSVHFRAFDQEDKIKPGDVDVVFAELTLKILKPGLSILSVDIPSAIIIDDQGRVIPAANILVAPAKLEVPP